MCDGREGRKGSGRNGKHREEGVKSERLWNAREKPSEKGEKGAKNETQVVKGGRSYLEKGRIGLQKLSKGRKGKEGQQRE